METNQALVEESHFLERTEAVDFINFHIIEPLEARLNHSNQGEELTQLISRAETLRDRLEALNDNFLQALRLKISAGHYSPEAFRHLFSGYVRRACLPQADITYDSLDMLVNGLLRLEIAPEETQASDPKMVLYQPTPARIILELVEQADIGAEDVFYDLGSGLGQVPILVRLLSGARTKGVEVETAYH